MGRTLPIVDREKDVLYCPYCSSRPLVYSSRDVNEIQDFVKEFRKFYEIPNGNYHLRQWCRECHSIWLCERVDPAMNSDSPFRYTTLKGDKVKRESINNLRYGELVTKEGEHLLQVSYSDMDGVRVQIEVKPNPTSASKLLRVIWSGQVVDPVIADNIAVLEVEALLRKQQNNIAELDGIKFCSLWTFAHNIEFKHKEGRRILRTQNLADRRYIFGRLWYSDAKSGETVVYWTRTVEKPTDRPLACVAVESGKYVAVTESHQRIAEKLFDLITTHDAEATAR